MATTRAPDHVEENPLKALYLKLALDLVKYLDKVELEEFDKLFNSALAIYQKPLESWIWYPFYVRFRTRVNELKKTHEKISNQTVKINELVLPIFEMGTWYENSFNTRLMWFLIEKLPKYGQEFKTTLEEIKGDRQITFENIAKEFPRALDLYSRNEMIAAAERAEKEKIAKEYADLREAVNKEQSKLRLMNPDFDLSGLSQKDLDEKEAELKQVAAIARKNCLIETDNQAVRKRELAAMKSARQVTVTIALVDEQLKRVRKERNEKLGETASTIGITALLNLGATLEANYKIKAATAAATNPIKKATHCSALTSDQEAWDIFCKRSELVDVNPIQTVEKPQPKVYKKIQLKTHANEIKYASMVAFFDKTKTTAQPMTKREQVITGAKTAVHKVAQQVASQLGNNITVNINQAEDAPSSGPGFRAT